MMKFTRLFVCIGLLQGGLLWWLSHSLTHGLWPLNPLVRGGILFLALFFPLVIYWTRAINELPKNSRRFIVLFYLIAYAALGVYSSWASGINETSLGINLNHHFSTILASAILCFTSLHLMVGFDLTKRAWKYDRLFHYAWRNAVLMLTATIITAAFWIVLYAGAELMTLIGVKWIEIIIRKSIFSYPATCLIFAAAFSFGLNHATITEFSRRFALAIASWLLVFMLFFAVVWVVAIPFTGVDTLFQTRSTALIALWFIALTVKFANCVYQDGVAKFPYPSWLAKTTQLAWLSLIPIVAITAWALSLRIQQYGWSPDRLWAALITALAIIYAVGYSYSWFNRTQWMANIGKTNIVAGLALCLGIVAFLTPIADINRISVNSHIDRVKTIAEADHRTLPDWIFLRNQTGRFGTKELEKMAAGIDVPIGSNIGSNWSQQAKDVLANKRLSPHSYPTLSAAELTERFQVFPSGQSIPTSFLEYIQSTRVDLRIKNCIAFRPKCFLWIGDLQGDGKVEIVFFDLSTSSKPTNMHQGVLFGMIDQQWKMIGTISARSNAPITVEQLNDIQITPSEWHDLIIGGVRYYVLLNGLNL